MEITSPLVVDLADGEAKAPDLVGGKAANLHVLLRAGMPVPPGFVVTTEAYRRAAARAGLDDLLDRIDDPAELAARARRALLEAEVPADLRRAVAERLTGRPVAVRSSATAEDLPHASFAGQQDTYLNVIGPDAAADAVRRCWASLWTDRAVAYRTANGIGHRAVRLAVVVQEMVDAEVAGVMFTADPVTGRRRRAVIDAAFGLGEAVVSGATNPDRFVVDVAAGAVVERRIGDKRTAVRPLAGGGVARVASPSADAPKDGEGCLPDERILELARLGTRVEDLYGAPQDTEWAIDGSGTIWLTQARPITTLFPIPVSGKAASEEETRVFFCLSLAQGLYRPITPMGMSAFRLIASSVTTAFGMPPADRLAGPAVFAEAAHRPFIDVTGALRSTVGRAVMLRVLSLMEARSAKIMRELTADPRFTILQHRRLPALRRAVRILRRHRIPPRLVRFILRPSAAAGHIERAVAGLRARVRPPAGVSGAARLDHAERVLGETLFPVLPAVAPAPLAGGVMLALAAGLLGDRATPSELMTVLRGLPGNVTTEMDLALWDLATAVRRDSPAARTLLSASPAELAVLYREERLPRVLQEGLTSFLAVYGHRAVGEIDLGLPRWSEEPAHILGVLANYLRLEDPDAAPDAVFARGVAEAERMIETLAGRVGGWRRHVVRFALRRARALIGSREAPKYCAVIALTAAREQIAAVGAELAAAGRLDEPDDVFFLTLPEARAALAGGDPRPLVAQRRAEYEREERRRRVPRVLLSDGTDPEAVARGGPGDGSLSGTPASPGVVTGTARVVFDPVGARLAPGEILVCPSTDPGWTPLFLTAGGLVMEMGGANSHGAVVAREYGIPAVVGVAHATETIEDGARITVDGSSGTVTIG